MTARSRRRRADMVNLKRRMTERANRLRLMVTIKNHSRALRAVAPLASLLALSWTMSGSAAASEHGEASGGDRGAESAAAFDPTLPRTFDLGEFYIRNFRPTHNEI